MAHTHGERENATWVQFGDLFVGQKLFAYAEALCFSFSSSTLSLGHKLYNLPDELAVGYLSRLSIRSALFSPRSFFFAFVCLAIFLVFFRV